MGQNKIMITKVDLNKIPAGIKYTGKIKNAISWNDKMGKNIVLTCETGVHENKNSENEHRNAEIFAYHYIVSENKIQQNWKIYDFVKDCEVDVQANFIKNTLRVTDLNNDGIGEVWIMYKTTCTGDVSPAEMKIIMYQGKQKYAMRGENRVRVSEKEFVGGNYTFDKAFNESPKMFKEFAKNMWNNNINQKW